MRAAFCCLFFLFAAIGLGAAASASPITAPQAAPDTASLVLVRGGCGRHFHPVVWRDRWGRRHRRCVPNRPWGPPPPRYPYPYYYYR